MTPQPLTTIACDANIDIPSRVAVCPICGKKVVVEIEEWEQNDDGTWQAGECGVHVNCITEPDIDSDECEQEEWWDAHWSTPYIDWLPVEDKVSRWINRRYRFDVKE